MNLNSVSLRTYNSAGLQIVTMGSGLSTDEHNKLMAAAVEDGGRLADVDGAVVTLDGKVDAIQDDTDKIDAIKLETDKIQDVVDAVDDANTAILGLASDLSFIKKVEGGKWAIVDDQMIFYDEDNTTEIMRFDITRDDKDNPIMRVRVP